MVDILVGSILEDTVVNDMVGMAFEVAEIEFDLDLGIDKDSETGRKNVGIYYYNQFVPAFF